MRFQTKSKKAGYQQYLVTITDSTEVKPTVTVMIENTGEDNWCQWRVGEPVIIGECLTYDTSDCCGFETKKDAIWWLQRDGFHIDENTVLT